MLPHLSELHGAATHLAVVAIPVYALTLLLRRRGRDAILLVALEPWLLAAAILGVATSGATGLLVWGQAQQGLRGDAFRNGSVHFWLGIALAAALVAFAATRYRPLRARRTAIGLPVLGAGILLLALVGVQGYLGGRMTYEHGVGVQAGGQFEQTATGAEQLGVALARGVAPAEAGERAFSTTGLGCAACHGEQGRGGRAPRLAGRQDLDGFRGVHGDGLFPPAVVSDRDVAALVAFLRTQPR